MKKTPTKKLFFVALVAFAAFVLVAGGGTHTAFAQATTPTPSPTPSTPLGTNTTAPNLDNCIGAGGNLATCGVYLTSYMVNTSLSFFVALGALLVQVGLAFNQNVFNSPTVQGGFSVVLALANLGFILGIIIIAIATILHLENYGIKKMLWKLIAVAILVNFGLVVTAPIVGFANSMSNYFMGAVGGNVAQNGSPDYGFITNLTNAFAPQQFTQAPITTNAPSLASSLCNAAVSATGAGGVIDFFSPVGICQAVSNLFSGTNSQSPPNTFMQSVFSLIFGIVFLGLEVLVLFGLALLLIVRYVYLGVLLIVLPLAWLAWVFPGYTSYTGKWWSNFIKWTFFPPAALFFIYLALITAVATNNNGGSNSTAATYSASVLASQGQPSNVLGTPATAIVLATGQSPSVLEKAINEFLLLALMVAGLVAASSLSGHAGEFVIKQAKSAGGAVAGYAGKKAKRVATYPLRTQAGRRATASLQNAGLNGNPLVRALTRPVREIGTVTAGLRASGEKQLSEEHKTYDKLSLEEQGRRIGSASDPGKAAILENLTKAAKSSDINTRRAADRVLEKLPVDMRAQLERFKLLYGKGAQLPGGLKGERTETFAEGGASKSKKAVQDAIEKGIKDGIDVSGLEAALKEMTEAEQEQAQAATAATAGAARPAKVTINVRNRPPGARFVTTPSGNTVDVNPPAGSNPGPTPGSTP